jgi:hypothetical protein
MSKHPLKDIAEAIKFLQCKRHKWTTNYPVPLGYKMCIRCHKKIKLRRNI